MHSFWQILLKNLTNIVAILCRLFKIIITHPRLKNKRGCMCEMTEIYALKFVIMSTISAPMRFWASTVAAPMCGVQETIG